MLRIVSEVPVLEDSLMRLLIIGLNNDFKANPADVLDIVDQMVRRAAIMNHEGIAIDSLNHNIKQAILLDVNQQFHIMCIFQVMKF